MVEHEVAALPDAEVAGSLLQIPSQRRLSANPTRANVTRTNKGATSIGSNLCRTITSSTHGICAEQSPQHFDDSLPGLSVPFFRDTAVLPLACKKPLERGFEC